jgi:hypothetical protein
MRPSRPLAVPDNRPRIRLEFQDCTSSSIGEKREICTLLLRFRNDGLWYKLESVTIQRESLPWVVTTSLFLDHIESPHHLDKLPRCLGSTLFRLDDLSSRVRPTPGARDFVAGHHAVVATVGEWLPIRQTKWGGFSSRFH